jgi:hypothetical protein
MKSSFMVNKKTDKGQKYKKNLQADPEATIIKKLDLLLLFPQFPVPAFLPLLYQTFHLRCSQAH